MDTLQTHDATDLSVFHPLDALFGEYEITKSEIVRIASYVGDRVGAMACFIDATAKSYSAPSYSALFDVEKATKCLDAKFWQRAIMLTDVLDAMDAKRRNEWNEQVRLHNTPTFERDSVISTVRGLLASRNQFYADRVDGLFRSLSGEHVTNRPAGFSTRMIINHCLDFYPRSRVHVHYKVAEYFHDMRVVIARIMGRDLGEGFRTSALLEEAMSSIESGAWIDLDGGAWKMRWYKKGTIHIEVHQDIAWQLNKILSSKYPMAIPECFRRKPIKQPKVKEYRLEYDLLPAEVLAQIQQGYDGKQSVRLHKPLLKTAETLDYFAERDGNTWCFGYDAKPVIERLMRMACLPEKVSHQFYPTPPSLSKIAVEMADIQPHHSCLEPSAGQGGITDFMPADQTQCVEISEVHCEVLRAKGYDVEQADFEVFAKNKAFKYSRIVMNPPFQGGRAAHHVQLAASLLADDGVLVAILPASNMGKTIVEGMGHEYTQAYSGEFKDASVSVMILKLTKK